MEYRFKKDYLGNPVSQLSTGHEALGCWLNEELKQNTALMNQLETVISELEDHKRLEFLLEGVDYNLLLTRDSAEVKAKLMATEMMDDLNEDLDYYDSESFSQCGLDDFKQLLASWQNYIA